MKRILYLAWRYVTYHRTKSLILMLAVLLTCVFPLTAQILVTQYGEKLTARARTTPLVLGAKGNRFDLVLKSLYFSEAALDPFRWATVDALYNEDLCLPVPLHLDYTAREFPLVGTTYDYFEFRRMRTSAGNFPTKLGQCVLGANVARQLDLGVGDTIFSDQRSIYDITRTYPLKMHIVGVLAPTQSRDDDAVFVDIHSAWVIDGHYHGHEDVTQTEDPNLVLERDDENVTAAPGIFEYQEITPENASSFHVHGDPDDLPVHAIVVIPRDTKAATILKARYNAGDRLQMLVAAEVVDELLGLVFQVKRFFDANFALILISTGMFIALVVLLSRRIRQREMETMFKIGCSRATTIGLQVAELGIILGFGLLGAALASTMLVAAAPYFLRWI